MIQLSRWFFLAALLVFAAVPVVAADNGQDDLDKATQLRLGADTTNDLDDIIRLADSALTKGLDEANTEFAKNLLSSTLIQRGTEASRHIFDKLTSADDFARRRQAILADLTKAAQLDPKQPQVYLLMAQVNLLAARVNLLRVDDVKQAKEALDKALALDIDDASNRAGALIMRARLQEQPEKRLADLDEAVRLTPDDANVVLERGRALAGMGKLDAALADLDKAIQLSPNALAHEAKAMVLVRLNKFDEALAALEEARKISPESVTPLVQEASVHAQQQNPQAAMDDLTQALAIDPNNVVVLLLRAGVYQEKGEKEKALADVDRALQLRPNLPVAISTRAKYLVESERFDEAIRELEKLHKLAPKDMLTLLQLGTLHNHQKEFAQAIETFSAALAIEPEAWWALHGRANAYLSSGKQSEALADFEKALPLYRENEEAVNKDENLASNFATLLNNFAWLLATSPDEKLRDGKRAIELATEACDLTDYKLAFILSTLAAAYAETGDFDTAVKWSSKAVEIGDKEHDDSLSKELENYKAKKPWRELLPEEKPAAEKSAEKEGDAKETH